MQAAKLKIKNFMAIKELEITADKFVQITGQNSQGKTSVLKAIETIFTGSTDGRYIKHGEDEAELILELPDETIRRVLSPKGHSVTVSKGEFKVKSPQTYLETIMDFRAFNPLSFLEPKNRKTAILEALAIKITPEKLAKYADVKVEELPPVDYDSDGLKILDRAYEFYYARRAEANKDALAKKNEYEVKSKDFVILKEPILTKEEIEIRWAAINKDTLDAQSGLRLAESIIESNSKAIEKVGRYEKVITDLHAAKEKFIFDTNEQIEEFEQKIINLQESLTVGAQAFDKRIEDAKPYVVEAKKDVKTVPDVEDFKKAISHCNLLSSHNDRIEQEWVIFDNNSKAAELLGGLKAKYDVANFLSEFLDKRVQNLKEAKSKAIKESNLPIEGLEILGEDFFINGTHLDNLSTSESAMLGLSVAQILAKKTKMICIDKFETLDKATRIKFIEKAKADEFFYWMADVEGEPMDDVQTITMHKGVAI